MNKLFLTCTAAGLLFSGVATAEYYAGMGYGASWNGGHAYTNGIKSDYDKFSPMLSLFAGTVFPTNWVDFRTEVELLRLDLKPHLGGTRKFRSILGNVTAVIPDTGWWAEPYVGGGVGYARWDHKNTIATQVIGGFEKTFELPDWANNAAMAVDLEYRHLWVNKDGGKAISTSKMNSDTLMLKLKYMF